MWILLFLIPAVAFNYTWSILHASSYHPDVLKRTVMDYRENFPCLDCKDHFQLLLDTHPFPLEYVRTSADARVWSWLTHNLVNTRLNKTWESFDIMTQCDEL
jgi:hypothetical protein